MLVVKHSLSEYVKGECTPDGIKSLWSMLKRAHKGTFTGCWREHLGRDSARQFTGATASADVHRGVSCKPRSSWRATLERQGLTYKAASRTAPGVRSAEWELGNRRQQRQAAVERRISAMPPAHEAHEERAGPNPASARAGSGGTMARRDARQNSESVDWIQTRTRRSSRRDVFSAAGAADTQGAPLQGHLAR